MQGQSPAHLEMQPYPFANEQQTSVGPKQGNSVTQKLRELRKRFACRAQRIKKLIIQAPAPSLSPSPSETEHESRARLQSLIHTYDDQQADEDLWLDEMVEVCCCRVKRRYIPTFPEVLDPQCKLYITWLLIVTLCYLYNAWAISLRASFPYETDDNRYVFFIFDYFSDFVYIIDILVFKIRVQYLHDGFWVDEPAMTRKNYLKKSMFKMDLLSLLPLDLLYLKYINAAFRIPRLLKIQTFWEFFSRVDAVAKSPYVIRILQTFIYMMYLIHLNACAYYAMSSWEGINNNTWVYNGTANAYIQCFYFATKTATSIGRNPKPTNEYEYVFMTVSWLMGVFIFAYLVGQVRDIVATATQSKTQYGQQMDEIVKYMRNWGLPDDLQQRVRVWLNHTWEQQKALDEATILDTLPRKLKTDVAISAHYHTLVKVQLFKDCDKALLRDLVLKLKSLLFLPGDYVCKRGEVGKEMYIVNNGQVQVIGGENGQPVLATLSEGSVFGEISLLGIQGCNRRIADVRSKGFSNLFVLSKSDLWDTLKNYPEAEAVLKKKAENLIRQNEAGKEQKDSSEIIPEPIINLPERVVTPEFIRTVLQALPEESTLAQTLKRNASTGNKPNKGAGGKLRDATAPAAKGYGICKQVNKELSEEESNKQKFPLIILHKPTEDIINKEDAAESNVHMQKISTISNNSGKIGNLTSPEQLTMTVYDRMHDNGQLTTDQSTDSMQTESSPSEKTGLEKQSAAMLHRSTASTESSPSTETDEPKKVAQDANEFLNSILQFIPTNCQSLSKRPVQQSSNWNNQSLDGICKTDSTASVFSLNSLFQVSNGDGVNELGSVEKLSP